MATRKKHLINVHTSTGTTAPTAADLRLGEIAVQHTSENPALWIKMGNAESSAVYEKFIGSTEITNMFEGSKILGSGYTYSGIPYVNSSTTIADAYSALTNETILNEKVMAEALNDLNTRIEDLSAATEDIGGIESITMNGNTYTGTSVNLGTVVTAETQLSYNSGSSVSNNASAVMTGLTVSNHAITYGKTNKIFSASTSDSATTAKSATTAGSAVSATTSQSASTAAALTGNITTGQVTDLATTIKNTTVNSATTATSAKTSSSAVTTTSAVTSQSAATAAALTGNITTGQVTNLTTKIQTTKVNSATTADSATHAAAATKVDSALTINILDTTGGTASTVTFNGSANETVNVPANTDTATTETGHYTPSTSASTEGSATGFIKQIKLDSKNHVVGIVSGTTSYTETAVTTKNGTTGSTAAPVLSSITTGGTKGHELTLNYTNKVNSATTANSAVTATNAVSATTSLSAKSADDSAKLGGVVAANYSLTSHTHSQYATNETVNALSSATHTHVTNDDIHVTAAQKTNWTNSGTSGANAYVGYIAHSANTGIHVTAEDKTLWNAAITGVTSAGTGNAFTEYEIAGNLLTLKKGATYLTTAATTTQGSRADSALQYVCGSTYVAVSAKSGANGAKIQTISAKTQGVETSTATGQGLADAYDVKQYVDGIVSSTVVYKGATATLPTTSTVGDMYIATAQIPLTAAQSATGAAQTAETGDFIIARATGKWDVIEKNLDGAVTGSLTADTVTLGESTNSVKSLANGSNGTVLAISGNKPVWTSAVKVNSAATADSAKTSVSATTSVSAIIASDSISLGGSASTEFAKTADTGNAKIFYGTCSTAGATSAKTVNCPDFTSAELVKGALIFVTFDATNSAAVGSLTMDVNGTGAKGLKKQYNANSNSNLAAAGELRADSTYLFQYDGTNWVCITLDYNSDSQNYADYSFGSTKSDGTGTDSYGIYGVLDTCGRYRFLFESADRTGWVPGTTATTTDTTTARPVNQRPINPFGPIVYYHSTQNLDVGSVPYHATVYTRGYFSSKAVDCTFNVNGGTMTYTSKTPVFVKCTPQSDGSAIIDATQPITQTLPATEDGKIYIYLCNMGTTTGNFQLINDVHSVYYYKDGAIRLWTNQTMNLSQYTNDAGFLTSETQLSYNSGSSVSNTASAIVTGLTVSNHQITYGKTNKVFSATTAENSVSATTATSAKTSSSAVTTTSAVTSQSASTAADSAKLGGVVAANYSQTSHTHPDYVNQNAFGKIAVGASTGTAASVTDTITFSGAGATTVSIDTTNKKITISSTDNDTKVTAVGNHYTATTATKTGGTTTTTAASAVKGITYDNAGHIVGVTTGSVLTGETSISVTNGTTGNTAAAVITGITTGGTAGHALTLNKSNKVFSAGTADSASTVLSAITSLSAQTSILGPDYTYTGIPYVNSSTTIADAYSALTNEVLKDERVTSAALNNLNTKVNDLSATTVEGLDTLSGIIEDNEYIIAQAFNDLDLRIKELSGNSGGGTLTGVSAGGTEVPVNNDVAAIPSASSSVFGVVKTGSFLSNSNGTISVATGTTSSTVARGNHTHDEYATTATLNALSAATDTHVGDSDIHVTAQQKGEWNAKQAAIPDLDQIRSNALSGASAYTRVQELSASVIANRDAISALTDSLEELSGAVWSKEFVIAMGMNDLRDKIREISGSTSGGGSGSGLPVVTSDDNGKVLRVENGEWVLTRPVTVYAGTDEPAQALGTEGDIFLQLS